MTLATITHETSGIRIVINGSTVHHFANQSWLAESHAQLIVRNGDNESKLKDIISLVENSNIDPDDLRKRITAIVKSSYH